MKRMMKTGGSVRRMAAGAVLLTALFSEAGAQQSAPPLGCMDAAIRSQAQTIKDHYLKQGFDVYRDAMFTMERDQQVPVILTLQRGQTYEIIFVAHPEFKTMKLRVLDGRDELVREVEGQRNRDNPNYLIFSFTPAKTDNYLLMSEQNTKRKQMCGSFFILKADPKKVGSEIIHYSGR